MGEEVTGSFGGGSRADEPDARARAVAGLVAAESASEELLRVAVTLRTFVVAPSLLRLTWMYGSASDRFDAWLVARSPDGSRGVVYGSGGLGTDPHPWGVVDLRTCDQGIDSE